MVQDTLNVLLRKLEEFGYKCLFSTESWDNLKKISKNSDEKNKLKAIKLIVSTISQEHLFYVFFYDAKKGQMRDWFWSTWWCLNIIDV